MPWVRIDEHALNDRKLLALSADAFRLWVEGLAHCQKHLTDGVISAADLRGFRYAKPSRVAELMTSVNGAAPLWRRTDDGVEVHDYLDWNDDRETVLRKREQAKERMQKLRGGSLRGSREQPRERTLNVRDSTTTTTKDQDQNKPAPKPRRRAHPVENRHADDEPTPDRDAPALRDCEVGAPSRSDDRRLRVEGADEGHPLEAGLRLSEPGVDGACARAGRAGDAEGVGPSTSEPAAAAGAPAAPAARPALEGPQAGGMGGGRADAVGRVKGWSRLRSIGSVAS